MELYNSEQEQVEALKAWWDKNGKFVIAAIVVVLLAVFGWKSWMQQQQARAESASVAYQQMMDRLASDPDGAMEIGRRIVGEQDGTIYATMASLVMARIAVEKGDLEGASAYLTAAASKASMPELKALAKLRLSRVLLAQQKPAEALTALQGTEAGTLQAQFDELRGDILLAQGNVAEARNAYINALAGYRDVPEKHELVQLKLDDIAESRSE